MGFYAGPIRVGSELDFFVLYSFVPWVGVMALGYAWSLWQLYAVWLVAVALLYPACRWFADLKARRDDRWLSFL